MWLQLSSGRQELVNNEDHIKRLIAEGAHEIPDPRVSPESPVQAEGEEASTEGEGSEEEGGVGDGSEEHDGGPDQRGQAKDLRSARRKSGVQRPGDTE